MGLPADALVVVDDTRREAAIEFMQQNDYIDCLIPRGGPSLIQSILDNATVPYVIDGAGNCHIYVDAAADLNMALEIVFNAKTQRTGVCNAAESLVVHRDVAAEFLPRMVVALDGVELVGDEASRRISPTIAAAEPTDFADRVPRHEDECQGSKRPRRGNHPCLQKIRPDTAKRLLPTTSALRICFVREVDAAAVLVNASTRFVDGEEFGFWR